jgi:3-methyl-2-oxobutanoate hydroxymethyltransferase
MRTNKITVKNILFFKGKRKIVVLTAYDFPSAKLVDEAGMDVVLVGDSLGMVCLGYESTIPVTMADMLHHTRAARRAVKRALLVTDMPYGSYRNVGSAVKNAKSLVKEGGSEAVKLEGGYQVMSQVKAIVRTGIPVMGHLGMLPQSVKEIGGYKVRGKTKEEANQMMDEAIQLERAGVFSLVLECVPIPLAKRITKQLKIPTIGIGAGPDTDGQVLVFHDVLGFESPVNPKFVRHYADLSGAIRKALAQYRTDVIRGKFPASKESF